MPDDLSRQYVASLTNDNLKDSARRSYTKVTDTLATTRIRGRFNVYLHGNNDIIVRRGTTDVSDYYAVRRYIRYWRAPLNPGPPASRAGNYAEGTGEFMIDSADKPLGDFKDAPGFNAGHRVTTNERLLYEWVMAIERRTRTLVENMDGLYVIVLLDLTPTQYKFSLSREFPLSPQVVRTLVDDGITPPLPVNAPWKTEDDLTDADWLDRHTQWQPWGTYNSQIPLRDTTP